MCNFFAICSKDGLAIEKNCAKMKLHAYICFLVEEAEVDACPLFISRMGNDEPLPARRGEKEKNMNL